MSDEKLEFNLPPVPSEILNPEDRQDEALEGPENFEPLASAEFEDSNSSSGDLANSSNFSEGFDGSYCEPVGSEVEPTTFQPPPPPDSFSSPGASSAPPENYRSPAYSDEHTFFPPPPTPAAQPSQSDFQSGDAQPVVQPPVAPPSNQGNAPAQSATTIDPLLQYRGQEEDYYQQESRTQPQSHPRRPRRYRAGRSSARFWSQLAALVGAIILAVVLLRVIVFESFYITSDSMTPTLDSGDRIIVNKLSSGGASRGDLVVFNRPATDSTPSNDDLVKRVIALEGETIAFSEEGYVLICQATACEERDWQVLREPYLEEGLPTRVPTGNRLFDACVDQIVSSYCTVAPGHVYVLGDSRNFSYDSRFFGPIPKSSIVGRAFWRVWPIGDFGGI